MRYLALLTFFIIGFSGSVRAQSDSLSFPVDSNDYYTIGSIFIQGNKITKEHIIKREVGYQRGDTISATNVAAFLDQTRKNLINTSLFTTVFVKRMNYDDPALRDSTRLDILITVAERWYIWPSPIFEIADPNFNTWWETRDFRRTNYGLYIDWQNFRGRKEQLILNAELGYTQQFAIKYAVPYLDKKQQWGASFTAIYKQNDEITYRTLENRRLFFSDGSGSAREDGALRLFVSRRKGLFTTHGLETRFNSSQVNDSVPILAPDYFPQGNNSVQYFSLTYSLTHDKRDFRAYPLTGYYLQGVLLKSGFGIADPDLNVIWARASARKYFKLADRWHYAAGVTGRTLLSKNLPYYFQEGLGYGYFLRGYELYVIDGQHWGLFRSNLKFSLVPKRWHTSRLIPFKKFNTFHYAFYLNVFADAGYVRDNLYREGNPLSNQALYSTGVGLDFVTYYDKVFRIEYAINHLGESGFFLHFTQPI